MITAGEAVGRNGNLLRQSYHDRLDALGQVGAVMCQEAATTLQRATDALLGANLALAEEVIAEDRELDRMRAEVETSAVQLLALQAPVASELRVVVSALWIVSDLQRMGALAIHVAKIARRRYPEIAVPPHMRSTVLRMSAIAVDLAGQAETVLRTRDLQLAESLDGQDDAIDELHEKIFTAIDSANWPGDVPDAVDLAMLSRFYERFADHAVAVARRVIYLVTGRNVGGDTTPSYLPTDDDA